VVETVSEGWRRSCPGYRCCLTATSRSADKSRMAAAMRSASRWEKGDCRAGQDL